MASPRRAQHVAQLGYLPDYPAVLGAGPPQQARPGQCGPRRLAGYACCGLGHAPAESMPHDLAVSQINPCRPHLLLEPEHLLPGPLKEEGDPRAQAASAAVSRDHLVGNTHCQVKVTKAGQPQ